MALSTSPFVFAVVFIVVGIKLDPPLYLQLLIGSSNLSEDGKLNFTELAYKYGHSAEELEVVTEDDYILSLLHIPGDATRSVLLIHGNTATADCWISRGKISLAITLADLGYDIWAINLRGTRYSRRHRYLDPETQTEEFFNYTFYEMGVYDLPATIDVILRKTGQSQILAVGHSVGTTALYVLGAEKPEYNDKLKAAISLAPISFSQHMGGPCSQISQVEPLIHILLDQLNIYEILSFDQTAPLLQTLCLGPFGYALCIRNGIFKVFGYDERGLEPAFVSTMLGHYPGGSSTKTFRHMLQIILSNYFARFDYGKELNLKLYNSTSPPLFDLSKVTMKSALFVGKADLLATVADARRLRTSLPNVVHYQEMPYEHFNHLDFVWGRFMPDNLYPYLLKVIQKYSQYSFVLFHWHI